MVTLVKRSGRRRNAGAMHEIDERGRLAPTTRPSLNFGLTVGWMFGE
jgi:hypothetical protein